MNAYRLLIIFCVLIMVVSVYGYQTDQVSTRIFIMVLLSSLFTLVALVIEVKKNTE